MKELPFLTQNAPYVHKRGWLSELPSHGSFDIPIDHLPMYDNLISYLLKWCVSKSLIVYSGSPDDPTIHVNPEAMLGRVPIDILRRNPRTLCESAELERFLNVLSDQPTNLPMTDIQTLTVALSTLYPETLIVVLINKVYRALDALPNPNADLTWDEVHRRYPFLWVVIFIQNVVGRYKE